MKSGDLVGIFVLLILAFFGWKLWPQIRLALMGGPNLRARKISSWVRSTTRGFPLCRCRTSTGCRVMSMTIRTHHGIQGPMQTATSRSGVNK